MKKIKIILAAFLAALLIYCLLWAFGPACGYRLVETKDGIRYNGNLYTSNGCSYVFSEDYFYRVNRSEETKIGTNGRVMCYRHSIWVSNLDPDANIIYNYNQIWVRENFSFPDPYTSPIVGLAIYGYMPRTEEEKLSSKASKWCVFAETDISQTPITLEAILEEEATNLPIKSRYDNLYMFVEGYPFLFMDLEVCIVDGCVYIKLPTGLASYACYKVKEEYQPLFIYEPSDDRSGEDGIQPFHFGWNPED